MGDIRIEILQNGYEVSYDDPDIRAANNAPSKAGKCTPWKDPRVGFVFKTPAEIGDFLAKLLPKMQPSDDDVTEFSKAFTAATEEA